MYIIDFFKNLCKRNNIGLIIYLILNTLLIITIFSSGFQSWEGALVGLGIYLISLVVALSPIGEWILRLQNGCKKITDVGCRQRLEPLFLEVYAQAKQHNPELSTKVKMFMSNSQDPNAFATGRRTICVTQGLLRYSDEQIKGVMAHEFGHLAHKDTDSILVVSVGNTIVTVIFVIVRVIANVSMWTGQIITAMVSNSITGLLAAIFIGFGRVVADFLLVLAMRIWNQIGIWLCMHASRKNEFLADEYALSCGYDVGLCDVLASFGNAVGHDGLFAALASSHPNSRKRIENLQSKGSMYNM